MRGNRFLLVFLYFGRDFVEVLHKKEQRLFLDVDQLRVVFDFRGFRDRRRQFVTVGEGRVQEVEEIQVRKLDVVFPLEQLITNPLDGRVVLHVSGVLEGAQVGLHFQRVPVLGQQRPQKIQVVVINRKQQRVERAVQIIFEPELLDLPKVVLGEVVDVLGVVLRVEALRQAREGKDGQVKQVRKRVEADCGHFFVELRQLEALSLGKQARVHWEAVELPRLVSKDLDFLLDLDAVQVDLAQMKQVVHHQHRAPRNQLDFEDVMVKVDVEDVGVQFLGPDLDALVVRDVKRPALAEVLEAHSRLDIFL